MANPFGRPGKAPPAAWIAGGVIAIALILALAFVLNSGQQALPDTDTNGTDTLPGDGGTQISQCADSDSGKNIFENGSITFGSFTGSDSCENNTHVIEYYCENNTVVSQILECPQNYVCESGMCTLEPEEVPACIDSDGGHDKFVQGVVEYSGKNYTDECVLADQVREYHCTNGSVSSTVYACGPDFRCVDGACTEMPLVCTDTDSGKDEFRKGMVSITKGNMLAAKESDYCIDGNNVREFYCSGQVIGSEIIKCSDDYGCFDGACIYQSCEDSDGGQNLLALGTTSKGQVSKTDECSGKYNVIEYYCSDNRILSTTNTCPSGYWCSLGMCVVEPDCFDSDGGRDYYNTGTVTKGAEAYTDSCNGKILTEWYCDGKMVKSESIDCTISGACSGGACIVT